MEEERKRRHTKRGMDKNVERKEREQTKLEMAEDNSRDTDHQPQTRAASSLPSRGLTTMHSIHTQVVPHGPTAITASQLDHIG